MKTRPLPSQIVRRMPRTGCGVSCRPPADRSGTRLGLKGNNAFSTGSPADLDSFGVDRAHARLGQQQQMVVAGKGNCPWPACGS